ncbi:uncharacterized protein BDW70DRAFT_172099 [Aspergillus foveolatus]|uniref:uncharacterized protein n=1 Tax=Aspergillus foveolatus TaxID=210207 RepID=UPI003CCCCA75
MRDGRQHAFKLRLVFKTIRAIIDPLLDRLLGSPSDCAVEILCHRMIAQPGLGARVEQICLEEDEGAENSEDEIEDEEEDGDEDNPDSDSNIKAEIRRMAERDREGNNCSSRSHQTRIRKNDLNWPTRSTLKTQKWILFFQLSSFKSLALMTRTDKFTNMALFLRLPYLEELDIAVMVPGQDSNAHSAINYVPPVEILGTIISSTSRLRSLKFEDMSRTCFRPVTHDAPKLKRIIEQRAAATLAYLSICEFSHIKGYFGSMKSSTRLQGLAMQLEVLLGTPSDGLRLKDFQDLAEAAMDGQHLPWLRSVKMHLNRRDYFSVYDDWPNKEQFTTLSSCDYDPRIDFGLLAE